MPTESFLQYAIHDTFNNEIANSIIQSKQDCVDWFTYSYFYRRIHGNPSYYNVKDASSYGISVFLTDLVETSLNDLVESSFIEIEDPEINAEANEEDEEASFRNNFCLEQWADLFSLWCLLFHYPIICFFFIK